MLDKLVNKERSRDRKYRKEPGEAFGRRAAKL